MLLMKARTTRGVHAFARQLSHQSLPSPRAQFASTAQSVFGRQLAGISETCGDAIDREQYAFACCFAFITFASTSDQLDLQVV